MKRAFLKKWGLTPFLVILLFLPGCKKNDDLDGKAVKSGFTIEETTIAGIHNAIKSGQMTCRQLVEIYLKRIETYDQSTGLNSIVVINPGALERADELDAEFEQTRKLRPLHGIPVIVKDNYETKDMQTTGGSLALKGFIPPDEPILEQVFKEVTSRVKIKLAKDIRIEVPTPEHLLAMKLNSVGNRTKDHKRLKDICDIVAICLFSGKDREALIERGTVLAESEKMKTMGPSIEDPDISQASKILGIPINTIKSIMKKLDNN